MLCLLLCDVCLVLCVLLCHVCLVLCSMAGMFHTASRFATGMRSLRERVPDTWMAKGNEWTSLPLVLIR